MNSNLNGNGNSFNATASSHPAPRPAAPAKSRWDARSDPRLLQKEQSSITKFESFANNSLPRQVTQEPSRTSYRIEPVPSTSNLSTVKGNPSPFLPAKPTSSLYPPPPPLPSIPPPPPPPLSFSHPSSSKSVISKAVPPISTIPTVFKKPTGTRDYFVTYDPILDASPVKKGKELIFRYDGAGLDSSVVDPRTKDKVPVRSSKTRNLMVKTFNRLSYTWDRNSTYDPPPPPPSAVLVTGLPPTTTADQIHRFFTGFGRIETQQVKTDKSTGGSLGICWIKFVDDVPRNPDPERAVKDHYEREKKKGAAQDGHSVAELAVLKGNGSKIGTSMLMGSVGVKVEMDRDGSKCKKMVEAELLKRHPPKKIAPVAVPSTSLPPPSTKLSNDSTSAPTPRMAPNLSNLPRTQQHFPTPPAPSPSTNSYASSSVPSGPRALRTSISQNQPLTQPSNQPLAQLSNPSTLDNTHRPVVYGSVSQAVAAAVIQAKKRLELQQAATKGRIQNGREIESSEESGSEEEKEEKVFFARDSKRGAAQGNQGGYQQAAKPSNAATPLNPVPIISKSAAEEKLVWSGKPFLEIKKEVYRASRGNRADINEPDLRALFKRFDFSLILADEASWYLTFTRNNSAALSIAAFKLTPFAGPPLPLILRDALIRSTNEPTPPILPGPASSASPFVPDLEKVQLGKKRFYSIVAAMGLKNPDKESSIGDKATEEKKSEEESHLAQELSVPKKEKKLSGWTDEELVEEAKILIIEELLSTFRKDVNGRIISAKIMEEIENASRIVKVEEDQNLITTTPLLEVKALPSFSKKKKVTNGNGNISMVDRRERSRHSSEAVSEDRFAIAHTEEDESRSASPAPKKGRRILKKKSSRKVKVESEEDSDFEAYTKKAKLKNGYKKKGKLRIEATFTSSEEEKETNGTRKSAEASLPPTTKENTPAIRDESPMELVPVKIEVPPPITFNFNNLPALPLLPSLVLPVPTPTVIESDNLPVVPKPLPKLLPKPAPVLPPTPRIIKKLPPPPIKFFNPDPNPDSSSDESRDENFIDLAPLPALPPLPARVIPRREPKSVIPDPFEEGLVEDEEDLYYLKLAIERPQLGLPLHEVEGGRDAVSKHSTGSARTEGFYVVSSAEKLANRLKSVETKIEKPKEGESGVAVSRMARANVRGLVRGMELQKKLAVNDSDVLKFNQLRTRKKMLSFSRSGIHDYGLFSLEHIPAGEMVIEYVGELVRQAVADRREKAYERQGIGSSYLFRVDEDLVVDATKKGNLGRLINHCCVPNCNARIITISGEKKIVIYAKTAIERGDEVTYDYHFPHEEIKIPCLCGHALCRKYLN